MVILIKITICLIFLHLHGIIMVMGGNMSDKNYKGSKFNGLRDKERKFNREAKDDSSIYECDTTGGPITITVPKEYLNTIKPPKPSHKEGEKWLDTVRNKLFVFKNGKWEADIVVEKTDTNTSLCDCNAGFNIIPYSNKNSYKQCKSCKADLGDYNE